MDKRNNNDALMAEKGRKFLEELKKKGASNDKLKQTFVISSIGFSKETSDFQSSHYENNQVLNIETETEMSLSSNRKLRKLLAEIKNEFSAKK